MAFPGFDLYGHLMYAEGRIAGKSKQRSMDCRQKTAN